MTEKFQFPGSKYEIAAEIIRSPPKSPNISSHCLTSKKETKLLPATAPIRPIISTMQSDIARTFVGNKSTRIVDNSDPQTPLVRKTTMRPRIV